MYAIYHFLEPACLTRPQYWVRLLILVPIMIAFAASGLSLMDPRSPTLGIPVIWSLLSFVLLVTVDGRLRHVGIVWFRWLAIVSWLLYYLTFIPLAVILALAAADKMLGIDLFGNLRQEPPNLEAFVNDLRPLAIALLAVRLQFVAVLLAAGILKGDPERQLKKLTARIAREPNSARLYYARGRFLAGLGRNDEAIADFDMAINLSPQMRSFAQQAKASLRNVSAVQKSALSD